MLNAQVDIMERDGRAGILPNLLRNVWMLIYIIFLSNIFIKIFTIHIVKNTPLHTMFIVHLGLRYKLNTPKCTQYQCD